MRSSCPTPACRRHDAHRPAARRASSTTRSSCCCAAPLRAPGRRTRRGERATSGAASLVPHPRPRQISRPRSLPRAFVIAFVRRHCARTWRPAGRPGSESGRRRRKPCTQHATTTEAGSEHDSGCRWLHPWATRASCDVVVTTRPSRARAWQFQSAGETGRARQRQKRPAGTHHGAAPPHSLCPCLGLLPALPARSAGTSARPRCC
jgi:hypothetical protein